MPYIEDGFEITTVPVKYEVTEYLAANPWITSIIQDIRLDAI